jgi:hypothetical protein
MAAVPKIRNGTAMRNGKKDEGCSTESIQAKVNG